MPELSKVSNQWGPNKLFLSQTQTTNQRPNTNTILYTT